MDFIFYFLCGAVSFFCYGMLYIIIDGCKSSLYWKCYGRVKGMLIKYTFLLIATIVTVGWIATFIYKLIPLISKM